MKKLAGIAVILVIVGGGYYLWQKNKGEVNAPTPDSLTQPANEAASSDSPPPNLPPQGGGMEQQGEGEVSAQEISMTTGGFFFTPKEITLKKGQPVKITIQSQGRHTFTIDELQVNKSLSDGANVAEFTPDTAGVFIYYCAIPGHRQAGQWGTVTVEE